MSLHPENPNVARLDAALHRLTPLLDRIVLVGGCATGLLVTDPAAAPVRATLDVDVIIEIASYVEFTRLEESLRQLGFRESHQEGAPVCRWICGDLILDVMPIDPSILGFGNRWYRPAFDNAARVRIGQHEVRLITAPYFLATKLVAFHRRGNDEYRMSHDLEDIVTVLDGRSEIVAETNVAPPDLRKYLSDEFQALLLERGFIDALPGHLLPDSASQQRVGLVLERIKRLIIES